MASDAVVAAYSSLLTLPRYWEGCLLHGIPSFTLMLFSINSVGYFLLRHTAFVGVHIAH